MRTVRFSKVVERSGTPEIFLLLSARDRRFQKALKARRIMTLRRPGGAKPGHGQVGYDPEWRGQILLFPKSLKAFEGARIVGIHYDLVAGEEHRLPRARKSPPKKAKSSRPVRKRAKTAEDAPPESGKVIPFPQPEAGEEDDDVLAGIKGRIHAALLQLEKGNTVAACNLLQRALKE